MSNLEELHETAGYFVRANLIDSHNMEVSFPSNIIIDPTVEAYTAKYNVHDNVVTKETIYDDKVFDTVSIEVPEYARRVVVLADIMVQCGKLNINHELIFKYVDGERIGQDETLVDMLEKPKERYLEMVLLNIFNGISPIKDLQKDAEAVVEGYQILLTILETGGL